jgi:hypothetical protein
MDTISFRKEVDSMNLELTDTEKDFVCHALKVYLSDLREEIVKTEKHEMKADLHEEEKVLQLIINKLS